MYSEIKISTTGGMYSDIKIAGGGRRLHGSVFTPSLEQQLLDVSDVVSTDAVRTASSRRGSVNEVAYYKSPRERNMGILGAVASVMNAVIGTGILALPVGICSAFVASAGFSIRRLFSASSHRVF